MGIIQKIRSLDRLTIIKNSFLLPILLVVVISISHVASWYDLGNPLSWAIYLSIAIEVFALASVSAASVNINRSSVWFLFGLVTSIQIIGNIFFDYNDIDASGKLFKSWVELIQPLFEDWDVLAHKRFLATLQGGLLPLMSLTALHYYIKFGDQQREMESKTEKDPKRMKAENALSEMIANYKEEMKLDDAGAIGIQKDAEPDDQNADLITDTNPTQPEQPEPKKDDDDIAPYVNNFE